MLNQNLMQKIQMLNEFKNNFRGDPKAEMLKLIQNSGMPQSELNKLQNEATQIQNILKTMK